MMRSNAARAKAAIIGLWLLIIGLVAMISLSVLYIYMAYSFVNKIPFLSDTIELIRYFVNSSMLLFLVSFLFCAVAFILWFTRAYRNLHVLLPNSKKKYPFWVAAIAWFVPFFNFVAPYKIATDLFDKTERYLLAEGAMDLRPKYDIMKGMWWATSLVSFLILGLSFRIFLINAQSKVGLIGHFIGFSIAIVAVFFAIRMIKNYREMEKLIQQVESGSGSFSLKEGDLLD